MKCFAMVLCFVPAAAFAVVPVNGGSVTGGTNVTIDNSSGDQTDPHVSDDLAAYTDTATSQIRYYRFSTAADAAIPPGAGIIDVLSDVSGNLVAFSRIEADRNAIMVFDTTAATTLEIDPHAGSNRVGAALGNKTVAFIDNSVGNGDVNSYDLSSNTLTVVSANPATEQNPNVGPDGNSIVWEQCPTSIVNCNILKAIKSGSGWSVSAVIDDADPEGNPDTDGTTIAFDANHPSNPNGQDISFTPLAGGANTDLDNARDQQNPSISSGVIGFESKATSTSDSDLFIYIIATNQLIQITNTPGINEMLNDVSVLPSGQVRMVWAADDGPGGEQNIYGSTFSLPAVVPPPPVCLDRTATLDAKRGSSCQGGYTDAYETFSTPFSFAVPGSIPVVSGNAHDHHATLSWKTDCGVEQSCSFTGSSGGSSYNLSSCSHGISAGTVVIVSDVRLHLDDGDGIGWGAHSPLEAKVSLAEACATVVACSMPPPHPGHPGCPIHHRHGEWAFCGGDHFGHHGGDDGHSSSPLTAAPPPAMGCSSAGAFMPMMLLAIAALMTRRRAVLAQNSSRPPQG